MEADARRRPRIAALPLAAVPIVAGVVYALTACPWVLGGDNGELATLAAKGGVAHPSGYPLYILWLRAFAWLPARTPAHGAALATAILGAAAVWMLQRACTAWGASRASTTIVSAVFAFTPIAWDLATHAEVFALNALLALAIVALAAPGPPPAWLARARLGGREEARVALLGLLAGLGLANHHSIVLLAPLGLFAAGAATRRAARPGVAAVAGVAGLALGLLPYAYLVWVARTTPVGQGLVWGAPSTFEALLRHFLRADYGTTRLSASDTPAQPLVNLFSLARDVGLSLFALPLLALAGAVVSIWRRRTPMRTHLSLLLLVATFALAGPAFVAQFNLPDSGIGPAIAARFHLLPMTLAAVLAAVGLDALAGARVAVGEAFAAYGAVLAMALGAARAYAAWPEVAESQRPTTQQWIENVFRTAPPNAIVIGASDAAVGGFFYEKIALGKRPDLVLVSPPLLLGEWYPRHVSAELGFEVLRGKTPPGATRPVLQTAPLVVQLLESGRPVLAADWFPRELAESAPSYPLGPLVRLLLTPRGVPDPYALEQRNLDLFATFELELSPPRAQSWGALLWSTYARPWTSLAPAFDALGDPDHAAACRTRAARFTPRP